ncbi:glucose-1-phosphate thymidylyltransferase [Oxyplasma meridianum]|uniref:Glucose-1-phosphate thymidylyltransferase n=1 Tax=Oxyplasma meridianum TaxID=3073602 RepID=A0AAX4NGG7_9ARCH
MKGILLHGGSGTRLRPFTYSDVKQLLPVAGKPVSEYALKNMIDIGIKDFAIIIGNIGGEEVKNYYGNGEKWDISIEYIYQDKPLGIAHAIYLAKDFIKNSDFVAYLGDNIVQNGIKNMYNEFIKNYYDAFLLLANVKDPRRFGVAEVYNNKIINLVEKPENPKSDLALVGVYFLKPDIFNIISNLKPSLRGELEITDALKMLLNNNKNIGYSIVNGWWKDTGTPDEFLDCNRLILDEINNNISNINIKGRIIIEKNAIIDDKSKIFGPCYIGKNTKIENSVIRPYTSIGNNCHIKNSEIEDSVIMDNTNINYYGKRISESIIGPYANIEKNENNNINLILGRDSKIRL